MRIYFAQTLIDQTLAQGRIQLDGDLVRLDAHGVPMQLFINPAVYFERIDGEGTDAQQLIGCVKSSQELAQMGAEHYDTSVVLGDLAYTVVPGFLGTPVGPDGTPTVLDPASWQRLSAFLQQLDG
jgi:hypothetical protein